MNIFNLHTHSIYSDGTHEPRAYINQAIKQDFSSIGFSEHSPLPFKNNFSILESQLNDYCKHIQLLKNEFEGKLNIYLSMEFDYIPKISENFKPLSDQYNFDYIIGSVHLVANEGKDGLWFIDGPKVETYDKGLETIFKGNIKKAVEAYFYQMCLMIEEEKPDIVGHLDKIKMHNNGRYFSENEGWYKELITKTLKLIADAGIIMEVNTRGIYKKRCNSLFPDENILRESLEMNIPVTVTTDAHRPEEIAFHYLEALQLLQKTGYHEIMGFDGKDWRSVAISDLISSIK